MLNMHQVCMYVCMCEVYVCIYKHICMDVVSLPMCVSQRLLAECLPSSFSTLFLETVSHSEFGAPGLARWAG